MPEQLALVALAAAFAAFGPAGPDPNPDPNCARGVSSDESAPSAPGAVCCAPGCGRCSGAGCGALPGGGSNCCGGAIKLENRSCAALGAPCIMPEAPPPPTECGDYPAPLSTTMPNALMIGDSISMPVPYTPGGYGIPARAMLLNRSIAPAHAGGWAKGGQASNTVRRRCGPSASAAAAAAAFVRGALPLLPAAVIRWELVVAAAG